MAGKTIQIYVPSGDPRLMRIAEITTRIVRAFEIPRPQISEFLQRSESTQVGTYILFGENESGAPIAYIGQSGLVGARLAQHNAQKEFWARAVVFVSLTNNWTQTHATYLEWLCIKEAIIVDRYTLENGNSGAKPFTPEALESDCFEVFETTRILLTTLGYPIFEKLASRDDKEQDAGTTSIVYTCSGKGGAAGQGKYTAEGFVVFRGSLARKEPVESLAAYPTFAARRTSLISSGKLREKNDVLEFSEDVLFSSPSAASDMVLGRSSNGWIDWIAPDGRSLDMIERKSST
jgi:hypothetical protein